MFRLQNNVPEIYPDKSRDFQLFCRLFDVAFNGVKQSIDTMQYVTSTMLCDSSLLPLLKDKLGFVTSLDLQDKDLRYILDAFPTIIRYKGSRRAFQYIVNLYSRLVNSDGNSSGVRAIFDDTRYIVEVSSDTAIAKSSILFELLKYVLPAGYTIDYYVTEHVDPVSILRAESSLDINVSDTPKKCVVINAQKSSVSQRRDELTHTVNLVHISNSKKD